MFKKIFILILIFIFSNCISQELSAQHAEIHLAWLTQGNVIQSLSGIGVPNSTSNMISNISSSNPASLSDFMELTFGISKQFNSKLYPAWIVDIGYKPINNFLPQSAGIVVTKKHFRIGVGFKQKYNSILDLGENEIRTIELPEGTGEKYHSTDETIIYSYSGIFSYSLMNFFTPKGVLNLGLRFDVDRLWHKTSFWNVHFEVKDYTASWSAGIRYDVKLKSTLNFKTGLFYEKNPKFKTETSIAGINTSPDINNNIIWNEYPVIANLPDKLHFGIFLNYENLIGITTDLTKIYWSQLQETGNDHINISSSLIFRPIKIITASIGYLSMNRIYDQEINQFFNVNGKLHALFITAGLIIKLNNYELEFSYANSKNGSSGEWYKQTISKVALNYYL